MWRLEYWQEKRPMDIVIIAGLNNINKGEGEEQIMARIRDFTEVVREQSSLFHPSDPSTIVFATFIYAPQQCWFRANGPHPYNGYDNKLDMVRALNDRIIDHNDETFAQQRDLYERLVGGPVADKSLALKFYTYGLRKTTMNAHRWEH